MQEQKLPHREGTRQPILLVVTRDEGLRQILEHALDSLDLDSLAVGSRLKMQFQGEENKTTSAELAAEVEIAAIVVGPDMAYKQVVLGAPKLVLKSGNQEARDSDLESPESANEANMVEPPSILALPVRLPALTKALRELLQRPAKTKVGTCVFDGQRRVLEDPVRGRTVRLTERETQILQALIAARATGLSRQDLLQQVWQYHPDVDSHTLETHIHKLRQKVEQDPANPEILLTERGHYRLVI